MHSMSLAWFKQDAEKGPAAPACPLLFQSWGLLSGRGEL